MNTHERLLKYRTDYEKFAGDCLYVRDHLTASITQLKFRPGQRVMHEIAEKQKAERGCVRAILLKNRRFGGSTYIGGRGYHLASMNFNRSIFIMGHETDSTTTLYRMVQMYQEKNPIPPAVKTSNSQELLFDNDRGTGLKSEYRLATAKNVEAGRSQGIHFLHCSEEAMYPGHAKELLSSLFACVPDVPAYTEIWRESTAKGYGNTFQVDAFKAFAEGQYPYFRGRICDYAPHMPDSKMKFTFAYENPEDTEWILIFIPFFIDPACQREFENDDMKASFLSRLDGAKDSPGDVNHEAHELREKYGLTIKQLYWREHAIKNKCGWSVETFHQEFPAEIMDSFLTKGTNVYSKDFCDMVGKSCRAPIAIGVPKYNSTGVPVIEPHPAGKMQIWERYNPREQYFLTVDAAGGFRDKSAKEPDPTNIDVWNFRTGRQVAQWHGHIDYDAISDLVELIGGMYGKGTACVELNNHGYTVVAGLKASNYPMYYYKPGEPGWSTNKKTKPKMVDDLLEYCRDGALTIRCAETIKEMRSFVEANGKFGAESGCHDDRVDTAQMAAQMLQLLPKRVELQDEPKGPPSGWERSEASWMAM